jgi:CRISPR/Cas system CSM-associated protein Csm3 (group 7 of RAMP superfamily)
LKAWKITLILKDDFHTRGESRGAIIDILRDAENNIFIPASHIKGVVRTEAERILPNKPECYITGKGNKEGPSPCDYKNTKCIICPLFGFAEQEKLGGKYQGGKLKFLDFYSPIKSLIERVHVRIDRKTGAHGEEALYMEKIVPRNTKFIGFVLTRTDLDKEENRLLEGALYSAAHYGFGSGRSRGLGTVEVEIEKNIDIGELMKVML